jgi:hypothetical protein
MKFGYEFSIIVKTQRNKLNEGNHQSSMPIVREDIDTVTAAFQSKDRDAKRKKR